MKKQYQKPIVRYESFRLSETIASGCEGIGHFGDFDSCSVDVDFYGTVMNIYNDGYICEYTGVGEDPVCYHAPSEGNNVFSS